MEGNNEVVYLYLDDIIPNRFQPREVFDDQALKELAVSIKEHGVIQPIIVRKVENKYEIIAGERRYKASTMAGLTKIPAIVKNLDDKESSKVALLENLQRKDLNAIEEARTYQKILELDEMTQEELAKTMGKSQPAIANKLRLLSLPEEVQDALLKEKISERHARGLLSLDNPQHQIEMMNQVINNRMTVREMDTEIRNMKNPALQQNEEVDSNPMDFSTKPRFILDPLPDAISNEEEFITQPDIIKSEETRLQDPREEQLADLDYLLNLKKKPEISSLEEQLDNVLRENTSYEPIQSDEPDNKVEDAGIESLFPEEIVEDNITVQPSFDMKNAIAETRNFIRLLEKKGFVISTEEMDLENLYQITIKIDKNK